MKLAIFVSVLAAIIGVVIFQKLSLKDNNYPEADMEELYHEVTSAIIKTGLQPVAIVTGSTSGIGQELAGELYRLGAVVIIASRSKAKCLKVIDEIKALNPNSTGTLEVGVLDTSDLDSVKTFVNTFQEKYSHLNYLINNAGIHYMSTENSPLLNSSASIVSKQGYDLSFATNYMGHFLLTHSLLPLMSYGRIVNIASTYHFQSDGSTLTPAEITTQMTTPQPNHVQNTNTDKYTAGNTPSPVVPLSAAAVENTTFHHRRIAYGVSKLAQVLHVKELQRRLDSLADDKSNANVTVATANTTVPVAASSDVPSSRSSNVKAVVVCPGWVGTNILPPGPMGTFVRNNAFKSRESILAPMCAMLKPDLQGGEFVVNSQIPLTQNQWSPLLFRVVSFLGVRELFTDILAMVFLLRQSATYGCHVQQSSVESNDESLARNLYDWTLNELSAKGYY